MLMTLWVDRPGDRTGIWYVNELHAERSFFRSLCMSVNKFPIFMVPYGSLTFKFCKPVHLHRVLVGKPEGKTTLRRPRRRWEDNIKMDLQDVGGGRGDWMELAQDRDRWRALVGTVRDFRVP